MFAIVEALFTENRRIPLAIARSLWLLSTFVSYVPLDTAHIISSSILLESLPSSTFED